MIRTHPDIDFEAGDKVAYQKTATVPTLVRAYRGALGLLPLRARREYLFYRAHGRLPNLSDPQTFSEKVLWRILFDRRELLDWTCDKQVMKRAVQALDRTVQPLPTLWYGDDVDALTRLELPPEWVIKPNRQSGGKVYFGSGAPDVEKLAARTSGWLAREQRHIDWLGEWAYSVARTGLLVEPRIPGPEAGAAPIDYKIFVFDGVPQMVQVHVGRGKNLAQYHLTPQWKPFGIRTRLERGGPPPVRPRSLDMMLQQAARIAREFDFLRVDFYDHDGEPIFGEVTPYPAGGLRRYYPKGADLELGNLWKLPFRAA